MTRRGRQWRFFVSDMIEFCEKVIAYSSDMNMCEFVADPMRHDATVFNIGLIGEAATNVPDEIQESFPSIKWANIIAMRNQLIHGYFRTRNEIVWETIRVDIPNLLVDLRELSRRVDKRNA